MMSGPLKMGSEGIEVCRGLKLNYIKVSGPKWVLELEVLYSSGSRGKSILLFFVLVFFSLIYIYTELN